ncbi:MAG: PorP/SprF family type IX secretion system membrane protein [bacterium]|nr:PorP/SprF family type IX secretion system membrane protein [bacterium]
MTFLLYAFDGYGQHYQFSQFYAAPTYLNPALTGANVCSRLSLNYRNQWSGVPGTFTTFQASLDHTLKKVNSGLGIIFYRDVAGLGSLSTTRISFLYAYEAKINKNLIARGGLSLGSIQRKVDYSLLTFGDQLANGSNSTVEGFSQIGITYFDIGTGLFIYSKKAWMGFAADHLNKPNQSFMNETSPLPIEIRFHGGYKIVLNDRTASEIRDHEIDEISFAYNFKRQNRFNQIDLGFYYSKNKFVLGMWYRGIPLFKPTRDYQNNDALVFLFGILLAKCKIGYSFDYTLSKLSIASSKGAHEISLSYQLCNSRKEKKKKNILISCPRF